MSKISFCVSCSSAAIWLVYHSPRPNNIACILSTQSSETERKCQLNRGRLRGLPQNLGGGGVSVFTRHRTCLETLMHYVSRPSIRQLQSKRWMSPCIRNHEQRKGAVVQVVTLTGLLRSSAASVITALQVSQLLPSSALRVLSIDADSLAKFGGSFFADDRGTAISPGGGLGGQA